jgi:tRNA-splicing endonuclease subunit Sen34
MSIPLYVSNQKAYIWDPSDAATLRVQHHICGLATGTLPGVAQQNVFLGLPLVLMPEEVVLLVENGQSSLPSSSLIF